MRQAPSAKDIHSVKTFLGTDVEVVVLKFVVHFRTILEDGNIEE